MSYKVILLLFITSWLAQAQTVQSFEGIDASQIPHPQNDVDPNGAVGTKQYLEWVNTNYQAFDKVSNAPVWAAGPQAGTTPFQNSNMTNCTKVGGDGIITFDHLALRWVIALRSNSANGYYYCVAISNTDDLSASSLSWYTYQFALNPVLGKNSNGHVYWPDWPKFGTWPDAYYVSIDLNDPDRGYRQIGVVVCALDRTNMIANSTPRPMQCFSDPDPIPANGKVYLKHSLIPADVEGTTAPPAGRNEFLVSIENPPLDGKTTTSTSINLWAFHVDWSNPSNSTFTHSPVTVPEYTPGCYNVNKPVGTMCVPEQSTKNTNNRVDSVGDRFMPRFAYRNFGTYESFLGSHTIKTGVTNQQTGIRWYELRGSGVPTLYQSNTVNPGTALFRFMPSIAQDASGNAAAGYNVSSASTHPGIRTAWWNLNSKSSPTELVVRKGTADEENSPRWGDYSSISVDPVDDCTFWYVTEYFAQNETGTSINWNTRIANFKVTGCTKRK